MTVPLPAPARDTDNVSTIVPFTALPWSSTATQVIAAHETDSSTFVPSMLTGADQLVPLNVNALPRLSTAAHNALERQNTDMRALPVSPVPDVFDHELPLKTLALPLAPTARQNEPDTHETDLSWVAEPTFPPTVTGADQLVPLKVIA